MTEEKNEAVVLDNEAESAKKRILPPEQKVLMMACLNPIVARIAIDSAKENDVEVVILEDQIIHDYISSKKLKTEEESKEKTIDEFLNNKSNRLQVEEQCIKLWTILTGGHPIEDSDKFVFTRTDVVKKTNLSHKKANQLLELFRVFGMLEYTKGNYEFKLHFNPQGQHQTIQTEIISMCELVSNDILRLKASIESDSNMTEEEKNELYEVFKNKIRESIRF